MSKEKTENQFYRVEEHGMRTRHNYVADNASKAFCRTVSNIFLTLHLFVRFFHLPTLELKVI